jgi:hypothetical protein
MDAEEKKGETIPYITPSADPALKYSNSDLNLLKMVSSGFSEGAFGG